jgi:hypothetical protein
MRQGNFSAVYDNKFVRWIDDMNVRLDYNLPNYMTKAEREMNFFQRMGTANLWANDVLGSSTYTLAAIGTEALWAAATGGASLATAGARMAFRGTTKGMLKQAGRALASGEIRAAGAASRAYLGNAKSAMNTYLRSLGGMKTTNAALGALNTTRFMYTSAGWEASVESYQYLKNARRNFYDSFEQAYGRQPNSEEIAVFEDQALNVGNAVFASNVAIVGGSNVLMFGKYFGIGTGAGASISRATNRMFGIGAVRGADGVYTAMKANRLQRIAKKTVDLTGNAFREGVWEEGMQAVVSTAGEEYIRSRFDPSAVEKNIGFMNSMKKGFEYAYGTNEGQTEVGIGMIIGSLFGIGSITKSGRQRAANEAQIKRANEANKGIDVRSYFISGMNARGKGHALSEEQLSVMNRVSSMNVQLAQSEKAEAEFEKGNIQKGIQHFNMSVFAQMEAHDAMGMLDDAAENFNHLVENTETKDIQEAYGVSEEQAIGIKNEIKNDYARKLESYKRGSEFADLMIGDDARYVHAKKALALNVFLAEESVGTMHDLSETIGEITGIQGVANAFSIRGRIDRKKSENLQKINDLKGEIDELARQVTVITQSTHSDQKEDIDKKNERVGELNAKMIGLQEEQDRLVKELEINLPSISTKKFDPVTKGFVSSDHVLTLEELLEANRELDKLDKAVALMRRESPEKARMIESLVDEYRQQLVNFRSFNETIRRMSDRQFMWQTQKGLSKILRGFSEEYVPIPKDSNIQKFNDSRNEEESEIEAFDELGAIETPVTVYKRKGFFRRESLRKYDGELDAAFENGTIDEDELYTYKAFNHMFERYAGLSLQEERDEEAETVTDEAYADLMNEGAMASSPETRATQERIAEKNLDKRALTPREQEIYERYKVEIDEIERAIPVTRGDTALTKLAILKARLDALSKVKNVIDRNRIAIDEFAKEYHAVDKIE